MAEIVWTVPALNDLEAIAEYIALDNRNASVRLVRLVFAHVEELAKHPLLGPRIPELLPASRYRQVVEPPCRVFYRYEKNTDRIFILGVIRGEKLFQKRLLHRKGSDSFG